MLVWILEKKTPTQRCLFKTYASVNISAVAQNCISSALQNLPLWSPRLYMWILHNCRRIVIKPVDPSPKMRVLEQDSCPMVQRCYKLQQGPLFLILSLLQLTMFFGASFFSVQRFFYVGSFFFLLVPDFIIRWYNGVKTKVSERGPFFPHEGRAISNCNYFYLPFNFFQIL